MTLRVVMLTTYYRPVLGGVESNAERLSRYLESRGFDVRVVTKRVTPVLPDRERLDGIPVERIGPLGHRSAAGKWRLLPHAAAWLVAHRADYDAVCCIDFRGVGLAALAARAVTGRPVLFQAQTPGVFRWPVSLAYRRADAVACIGHEIEREAMEAGVPRSRIHFLPNAIDFGRFRPPAGAERDDLRRALGIPPDAIACLFVGRLSVEKGLMDLMEAWRLTSAGRRRGVLLVAGPDMDGHPWNVGPQARELAREQRLASVRFLGPTSEPEKLMRAADIFVQPSHFEAQGLSAVEALASGVPVVASAVGGLLDFVKDNVNGRLTAAKDPAALSAALQDLIDRDDLRHRLAGAARPSVEGDYDERIVFERFAALVRHLTGAAA